MKLIKHCTIKPQCCILNEFYLKSRTSLSRGLTFRSFKSLLLHCVEKIIQNNGVIYTSDFHGVFLHILITSMQKNLKKCRLPESLNLRQNFKRFMKQAPFRKVYYSIISIVFSQETSEISENLKLKCCVNPTHYLFCSEKWKELYKFCQKGFLKEMSAKYR